jgi:hypothetical protein
MSPLQKNYIFDKKSTMARASSKKDNKKKEVIEMPRKSIKEIMDAIIDKEALEKRKQESKTNSNNSRKIEVVKTIYRAKREIMDKEKFSTVNVDSKFYLHYADWSDDCFVGPLNTEDEAASIIDQYIANNGQDIISLKPISIHTIILDLTKINHEP